MVKKRPPPKPALPVLLVAGVGAQMGDWRAYREACTTEEWVQVNQRHLIDKILARYSADFTVFRCPCAVLPPRR